MATIAAEVRSCVLRLQETAPPTLRLPWEVPCAGDGQTDRQTDRQRVVWQLLWQPALLPSSQRALSASGNLLPSCASALRKGDDCS